MSICRIARTSVAWSELPNGAKWYAFLARYFTTTDLTPAEIHELGLNEVARIRSEMEQVKTQVGFKGDLRRVLQVSAGGPALLLHRRSGAAAGLSGSQEGNRWSPAQAVRGFSEGGLRSARRRSVSCGVGRGRLLSAAVGRRVASGHLLREHVQPESAAEVRDGDVCRCTKRRRGITSRSRSSRSSRICRAFVASAATMSRMWKAGRSTPNRSARSSACSPIRTSTTAD